MAFPKTNYHAIINLWLPLSASFHLKRLALLYILYLYLKSSFRASCFHCNCLLLFFYCITVSQVLWLSDLLWRYTDQCFSCKVANSTLFEQHYSKVVSESSLFWFPSILIPDWVLKTVSEWASGWVRKWIIKWINEWMNLCWLCPLNVFKVKMQDVCCTLFL